MSIFVLNLSDEQAVLENVGGKGMSLAKLTRAGLPVPQGFHITTEAYRCFVDANGIRPRILNTLQGVDISNPEALEAASCQIEELFMKGKIPAEINRAISKAYTEFFDHQPGEQTEKAVAVRSSATAEDLPGASFAGQQDTYLNIRGTEAVLEAVKKCWASLWTGRAIAYRAHQGIDSATVALAVVVQELVLADAAGVLFTANPINGNRNEAMITATWGLGESIVSGTMTPDTLRVEKATGKVTGCEIAEKQVMTVRNETGTHEVPVPGSMKKKAVLNDAQAAELVKLGTDIEKLYGIPMDIEWTWTSPEVQVRQTGFAIVQARPITALPEPPLDWPLPHPKAVLARGSFAEFVPEPVSTLFATLAVPIACKATFKLMGGFGFKDKNSYFFEVINGYVYVGMLTTPKMVLQMIWATFTLSKRIFGGSRERALEGREKYLSVVQKWEERDLSTLLPSELLAGVREIFSATADNYNIAQSGTIPTATFSELMFGKIYTTLVKRKSDPEAATFLFGAENQALRAEKALFDLAIWAREQIDLRDYLVRTPAEAICAALKTDLQPVQAGGEFATRFTAYLQEFGHAIYDLDFAKPVPCEDPGPLVEELKVYLDGGKNPYERQRVALERRSRAADTIVKRLDPLRRKWFLESLQWAQETAPWREDSIADLGLGYSQIRSMLAEFGRRLAAGSAIVRAEDVYWLESQEVDMLAGKLEKGETLPRLGDEVEQRRTKWRAMRRITPPNTLPNKTWLTKFFPSNEETGNIIKGYGASAGKITALACVMLGPEDFRKMRPGDVIVAGITTPAWTPLFARAAAIVTDIGGPLGHSSIVAREYGIPAVLNTGSATRRIQNGQMITVDGSAGTVTLHEAESNDSGTLG